MAEITAASIVLMKFDAANFYDYGRFNGSLKFQIKSQEVSFEVWLALLPLLAFH